MSTRPNRRDSLRQTLAHRAVEDTSVYFLPSNVQRLMAYVLDVIFFAIAFGTFKAMLLAFFSTLNHEGMPIKEWIFQPVMILLYWVLPQYQTGQSIGKMVLGLKVVRAEHQSEMGMLGILGRELIGRALCSVTFGLGYIFIAARQDKRGLHDIIFGSQVVSIRHPDKKLSIKDQLVQIFAPIGVVGILISIASYIFFYSSYPIKQISKNLQMQGFEVQEFKGSLMSGISFDKIARKTEQGEIEITKGNFTYNGIWDILINRRLVIEKLQAAGFKLNVEKFLTSGLTQDKNNEPTDDGTITTKSKKSSKAKDFFIKEFILRDLKLENIEISLVPLQRRYRIEKIVLENLQARRQHVSLQKFEVSSQILNFKTGELAYQDGDFSMSEKVVGSIRRGFDPFLTRDLNFELFGSYKNKDVQALVFTAFDQKLRFELNNKKEYVLSILDWTPGHYLKTGFPLSRITMRSEYKSLLEVAMSLPLTGTARLRNSDFMIAPPSRLSPELISKLSPAEQQKLQVTIAMMNSGQRIARYQRGNQSFELIPQFHSLADLYTKKTPLLELKSNDSQSAEEALAHLYFGKPLTQLASNQLEFINHDRPYFTSPTVSPGAPTQQNPSPALQPRLAAPAVKLPPSKSALPTALPVKNNRLPASK